MTPTKVGIILIIISLIIAVLAFISLERKAAQVVEAIPKSAGVTEDDSLVVETHELDLGTSTNPTLAEEFEISAYTTSIDETDDTPCISASGKNVCELKDIVACPSRYKFGTRFEIAGNIFTCEDRMAAKYRDGNYLDILLPTKKDAMEWGRRKLLVKVL